MHPSAKICRVGLMLSITGCLYILPLHAQLRGTHLLGDAGLQSGSQGSPMIAVTLPFYYYHTSTFVTGGGRALKIPNVNLFMPGMAGTLVTNKKILGGNYGASISIGFTSSKLEGDTVSSKSPLAFTDSYVQPLLLGWSVQQADFLAGYAIYLPTGKYALNGNNNTGLGIWTNELSAGSTLYFDKKKAWNFSALFSYAVNSKKRNTKDDRIKVGNLLTIEGGAGTSWSKPVKGASLPMAFNAGMVYYMQFKTTEDKMDIPSIRSAVFDLKDKDHIYGIGAEGNIFFPHMNLQADLRWLWEFGARNRTEGNTFIITLTPFTKFLASKAKG
jgi:hypothetical protein